MRRQFRNVRVPEKEHKAAVALSHTLVDKIPSSKEVQFEEDVNFYAIRMLNIISPHMDMVKRKQDEDEVCTTIKRYIKSERPAGEGIFMQTSNR